eukprot:8700400-Pyramimonas_sp.AAC.1
MGSYTEPTRSVRDPEPTKPARGPIQSLHGLCGILYRAYTPCMGSDAEPTRRVWDPIQSLHGLHGILVRASTARA